MLCISVPVASLVRRKGDQRGRVRTFEVLGVIVRAVRCMGGTRLPFREQVLGNNKGNVVSAERVETCRIPQMDRPMYLHTHSRYTAWLFIVFCCRRLEAALMPSVNGCSPARWRTAQVRMDDRCIWAFILRMRPSTPPYGVQGIRTFVIPKVGRCALHSHNTHLSQPEGLRSTVCEYPFANHGAGGRFECRHGASECECECLGEVCCKLAACKQFGLESPGCSPVHRAAWAL